MQRKHRGYWTKGKCAEIAIGCGTRVAFKRASPTAYRVARENKWLDEICARMPIVAPRPNFKWPRERILETALHYTDFLSFYDNEKGAYYAARNQGIIDEATAHMTRRPFKKPQTLTKERCTEVALKCKTRKEFRSRFNSAYSVAKRNDWLSDMTGHMQRLGGNAVRGIYAIRECNSRRIYIGLSYDPYDRYRNHRQRPSRAVRSIISGPHSFKIITRMMPVEDAAVAEQRTIAYFRAKGWDVVNTHIGGGIGGRTQKWTEQSLQALAITCETRREMLEKHAGAYATASRLRLLETIFACHKHRGLLLAWQAAR